MATVLCLLRRMAVPAIFCATALLSQAQGLDLVKKVSFSSVAKPLRKLIPELAEATGAPLLVSPAIGGEVVVLHFQDAPLGEVLDKIAKALVCEWKPEGSSLRLSRSTQAAQAQEREELERRAQRLGEAIADTVKKAPTFSQAEADALGRQLADIEKAQGQDFDTSLYQRMNALSVKLPAHFVANRLLQTLDMRELAKIDAQERVVYSNFPTPRQRPLPPAAKDAIDFFVAHHNVYTEAINAHRPRVTDDNHPRYAMYEFGSGTASEGNVKVILTVNGSSFFDEGLSVNVRFVNLQTQEQLASAVSNVSPNTFLRNFDQQPAPSTDDAEMELSELSALFVRDFRNSVRGGGGPQIDIALRTYLARPEENDPLSLVASEGLIGLAKSQGRNLVSNPPDVLFIIAPASGMAGKLTPKSFLTMITASEMMKVESSGTWLLATPTAPVETRKYQSNRSAIGPLLRKAVAGSTPTLEDLSSYAFNTSGRLTETLDMFLLMMVAPDIFANLSDDFEALRLFGSLSAAQRQTLTSGGEIPLRNLTRQQQGLITSMVYGSRPQLMVTIPQRSSGPAGSFRSWMQDVPTELLPRGIPPEATLKMDRAVETVVVPSGVDAPQQLGMRGQAQSANDFAWQKFQRERPEFAAYVTHPEPQAFKVASRTRYQLHVDLGPTVSLNRTLQELDMPSDRPNIKYEQLPAEFRKEVDAALERLRKSYRSTPPPSDGG